MKTLIFTFCLIFFPCFALFNACTDNTAPKQPLPDCGTEIIINEEPDTENQDGRNGTMPKYIPKPDFGN